jgi:hypothetical protein
MANIAPLEQTFGNGIQGEKEATIINHIDFQTIEELDPSLCKYSFNKILNNNIEDGHRISFDKEVPFEIKLAGAGKIQ